MGKTERKKEKKEKKGKKKRVDNSGGAVGDMTVSACGTEVPPRFVTPVWESCAKTTVDTGERRPVSPLPLSLARALSLL